MADEYWRFVNDLVKPWDELNNFLVQRYAMQPDLSDVSARVDALSMRIKHQVDAIASEQPHKSASKWQAEVDAENTSARIISDLADTAKHRKLRKPERHCAARVSALFECNAAEQFRFLRNSVVLEHASLGPHDFLVTALDAIRFWAGKRHLQMDVDRIVMEAAPEFFPTAHLTYEPQFCLRMSQVEIQFLRRNEQGELIPYNPKNVRFEVY